MLKFQFLIGRLESLILSVSLAGIRKFQFLIGRLESTRSIYEQSNTDKFQFLIGRLESCSCAVTITWVLSVSIPYR